MKQTFSFIQLPESSFGTPATQRAYEDVVPNPAPGWMVVTEPLDVRGGKILPSSLTPASGDAAVVPLLPYLCKRDRTVFFGYAVQLGALLASISPNVTRLHLSLGLPLEETEYNGEPVWRLWIGACVGR